MATKLVTQLIDDLDGEVLQEGEGRQITFSLEGRSYEIDLSTANADELRDLLARYVDAARRIVPTGDGRSGRTGQRRSGIDLAQVREWARANGHTVSDRGRMPNTIIEAWGAAASN